MQLDNYNFSKFSLMQDVNIAFEHFLHETINLIEYQASEQGGGYFVMIYHYSPMGYEITFEHDRLMFSIRIKRMDGSFTSINHICKGEINNALSKENIYHAIKLLSDAIVNNKMVFYKVKKGRQVEVN